MFLYQDVKVNEKRNLNVHGNPITYWKIDHYI